MRALLMIVLCLLFGVGCYAGALSGYGSPILAPALSYPVSFASPMAFAPAPLSYTMASPVFSAPAFAAPLASGSKKQAPLVQNVVKTRYIDQPIIQTRTVKQPVLVQRLVEKPIVRTRIVRQPILQRVFYRDVVRPRVIEQERVVPVYQQQDVVVPKIIEQTIVKESFKKEHQSLPPQTLQPTFTGKSQQQLYGSAKMEQSSSLPAQQDPRESADEEQ